VIERMKMQKASENLFKDSLFKREEVQLESLYPRVVIIGAGFAGLNAARALDKTQARVTVIDRANFHLFQPLLYQVATAALSPADICRPIRGILKKQANAEVIMAEVQGVNRQQREVILKAGPRISYDYLVIATGATHGYFGHDEWEAFAPGLKCISDATRIREKILLAFESAELEQDKEKRKNLLTFLVVGAGPTGVEMAGAMGELSRSAMAANFRHINPAHARIILLEAGPRILTSFSDKLQRKAWQSLERLGVEVRTNAMVEKVDAEGVIVGGERLAAGNVVWAAGVVASPAGRWLNAPTDRAGRIEVLPDLSVPGHPEIFVAGDLAMVKGNNGKPLPGVAPVAIQQGYYIGRLITSELEDRPFIGNFRYKDRGNMATIGRAAAIAEIGFIKASGILAWLLWSFVHILFLISFRNRVFVMLQWIFAYLTYERGARLIVSGGRESEDSEGRDRNSL